MKNYEKLVREGRAIGELDHPDSSVVELKNASHLVTEVWWNGDDVMGQIEILDTPAGKVAKQLVKGGVQLGISSRGLGLPDNKVKQLWLKMIFNSCALIWFQSQALPVHIWLRRVKLSLT